MCRARWELAGSLQEDAAKRVGAAVDLTHALVGVSLCGPFPEALELGHATLTNLAETHMHMGSHELALSMSMEVPETERRVLGSEDINTLNTMGHVADLHSLMCNEELALPLQREALESKRQVLGSQHPDTATCTCIGAQNLAVRDARQSGRPRRGDPAAPGGSRRSHSRIWAGAPAHPLMPISARGQ